MPLLFSIGIHGALEEAASSMEHGEQLCAFLDDICVLCAPHRVVALFKQLSESLERVAGTSVGTRAFTSEKVARPCGRGTAIVERHSPSERLSVRLGVVVAKRLRGPTTIFHIPASPATAHRSTTMASRKPWKPCSSQCPVGRRNASSHVRSATLLIGHRGRTPCQ